MVNFGLNAAAILGIVLAVAGAGLYFVRSVRPELSRDYDIFFAAVGVVCGFILLTNGWRLDPILQFGQFLLASTTIFFAFESLRLRGAATEQARRNTPIVDNERPVSRAYREAELDELEPYEEDEERYERRRLRGYQDPRSSRRNGYETEDPRSLRSRNETEDPRSLRSRNSSDRYSSGERSSARERPRRPRPSSSAPDRYTQYEQYDRGNTDDWSDNSPPPSRRPRRPRPEVDSYSTTSRTRNRGLNPLELGTSYEPDEQDISTDDDYADYKPLDDQGRDESGSQRPDRDRPNIDPPIDERDYDY